MFERFRHSLAAKLGVLGGLLLLLCLPLSWIGGLIDERGASQQEAAHELGQTYAGEQRIAGPALLVPVTERWSEEQRDARGELLRERVARSSERMLPLFPDRLAIEGRLAPQERYRGIFRVMFYTLDARLDARFPAFDPSTVQPQEKGGTLEFGAPLLALAVDDVRGIEGLPRATLAGEALAFAPRAPGVREGSALGRGIHAPLAGEALAAWQQHRPLDLSLTLSLVGREKLSVVPLADETTAHLASPWPHPGFGGRFLAADRSVGDAGFEARWRVSSLASAARQQALASMDTATPREAVDGFDVSLLQPLNVYSLSQRAVKYGLLFVGLVLLASFMCETFQRLRLHPVQYGLVGLSIALFFLLLLALSEKLAFWQAYALSAGASVLLLGLYFSAVLGSRARGAGFAGYVALLHAALYGLLASENNALLLGALLLFGLLAALMLGTRRVDWDGVSGRG